MDPSSPTSGPSPRAGARVRPRAADGELGMLVALGVPVGAAFNVVDAQAPCTPTSCRRLLGAGEAVAIATLQGGLVVLAALVFNVFFGGARRS